MPRPQGWTERFEVIKALSFWLYHKHLHVCLYSYFTLERQDKRFTRLCVCCCGGGRAGRGQWGYACVYVRERKGASGYKLMWVYRLPPRDNPQQSGAGLRLGLRGSSRASNSVRESPTYTTDTTTWRGSRPLVSMGAGRRRRKVADGGRREAGKSGGWTDNIPAS